MSTVLTQDLSAQYLIFRNKELEAEVSRLTAVAIENVSLDKLVDKFLAWPLPESVCADLVATIHGAPHRSGTNLLTAIEARQMLEYLLCEREETT